MKNVSLQLRNLFLLGLLALVSFRHLVYLAPNLVILPYHAKFPVVKWISPQYRCHLFSA